METQIKRKSFILSKISKIKLPSRTSVRTEGLNIKYPDLEWFENRKDKVNLIWSYKPNNRIWTFSFTINDENNFNKIWDIFAKNNICIRTWGHCAYPLHKSLNIWWSSRISTYLYNIESDIIKFFETLDEIIKC